MGSKHYIMIVGIGIDIVEIDRIKNSVEKYGDHFLNKVFTEKEKAYCNSKKVPYSSLAGRFAAKEAAFKALGTGLQNGIGWQMVEIINDTLGKPTLHLYGKAKELTDTLNVSQYHVSISHCKGNAVAQVILEAI
jgi:holo-[acyl-carrier protein] synthase